jgi:enoyl-CoA hydratase/carnithine racemase
MIEQYIKAKKTEGIMIIALNRPEKRNALSLQMCHAIHEAIEDAALDKNIRIVVIRGEGQTFCAGIDFNSLAEINAQFTTTAEFRFSVSKAQDAFNKMEKMEKPVIALLHGHCFGMGLELALAADFRIACEGTNLGLQEVELGLIPDVGGTTRLTRNLGIPLAKELIMTGRLINAEEAYRIHLVNEVVRPNELDSALNRWIERLKGCAPLAVGLAKKIIDRGSCLDRDSFMELEAYAQSALLNTEDVKEGVLAKIQKRGPNFKGK